MVLPKACLDVVSFGFNWLIIFSSGGDLITIITKLIVMLKKNITSAFLLFAILLLIIQACIKRKENRETSKEECVSIFNGKDLTGWDIKIKGHPLKMKIIKRLFA